MDVSIGQRRPELVAPFTDAVRRAIEGGETGLAVAVYAGGELAVDMWAGLADVTTGQIVRHDTLFPTFSVIKSAAAVALHIQASRGLVEYDASIARYWPTFAANGKDRLTVRHVLHHRSGVWQMPERVTPERLADYDWMCEHIAELKPMFEPGTRRGSLCELVPVFGLAETRSPRT
jgi:CubicO group peptidase (beta-lactamase class C family)